MKNFVANLLLVFSSLVISCLLFEIFLRIFYPMQESMEWFESSEKYGYYQKKSFNQDYQYPNHPFIMKVRTNSFGHRYFEYDTEKFNNDNYKKILLIGDSFVFGHGVNIEDHIAYYLDNMFSDFDTNMVVINGGVGGWGTLQETEYAKDNFNIFNPDIIVLFFCGNDPADDIMYLSGMRDNEKGIFYFPGKVFLRNNSHFYRFLIIQFKKLLHRVILTKKIKEEAAILNRQSGNIISSKDWKNTLKYIRDFQNEFIKYNSNGVLLIAGTAPWNSDIRDNLLSISNDKNIYYVDLYDETINLSDDQKKLPHDGHWSPLIHKMFAQKIKSIIKNISFN